MHEVYALKRPSKSQFEFKLDRHFVLASPKSHVIKISKIFWDFVPRDPAFPRVFSWRAAILKTRRREGPGDEVGALEVVVCQFEWRKVHTQLTGLTAKSNLFSLSRFVL